MYQPLKEGYRAWAVGFALSAATKGYQADICYEFINWYLSWLCWRLSQDRQGYYSAVPKTAKEYMADYEWDYWMLGKPATQDIMAPDGKLLAKAGELRDGGSFEKRMGGVACWNMDESRYMVEWNEFCNWHVLLVCSCLSFAATDYYFLDTLASLHHVYSQKPCSVIFVSPVRVSHFTFLLFPSALW